MTQVDLDPKNQMHVEFLADTDLLRGRFEELIVAAQDIEIAAAWARKPEEGVQDLLWRMRRKVRKLVVGCSLCNTNPDFLKKWQGQPGFKVVLDVTEVFHPKLYLFRVGREVCVFIGSSNLTGGGFDKNQEANILLRGSNAGPIADAAAYIKDRHREATTASWEGMDRVARLVSCKVAEEAEARQGHTDQRRKVGPHWREGSGTGRLDVSRVLRETEGWKPCPVSPDRLAKFP